MESLPDANGQTVLVTGVNGYIASHIGLQLLEKGYTVRGTSRSASAEAKLLRNAFKGFEDRYQHIIVPDMTADGAFDDASKGVCGIIHTASPLNFQLQSADDFLIPAIKGNLSVLNSALKAGPQLRSVVVTSSIAAVSSPEFPADHAFTDSDWNTWAEKALQEKFNSHIAYPASKVAAERTFWKWGTENNHSFSLSAILPTVVMGPPIVFPDDPTQLSESLKFVWDPFAEGIMPKQIGRGTYIDVRDVAAIHVCCVEHPVESDGQRYLVAAGKGHPQAIADVLRKEYPNRGIPIGEPESGYVPGYGFVPGESSYDSNKALRALGWTSFSGFEKMILETAAAFENEWPERTKNN